MLHGVISHTLVSPYAVVVHEEDTFVAKATVVHLRRLQRLALFAQDVELFELGHTPMRTRQIARVTPRHTVAPDDKHVNYDAEQKIGAAFKCKHTVLVNVKSEKDC